MVSAQPHFIAHLTLTTFSHESVAIYNSYGLLKTFSYFTSLYVIRQQCAIHEKIYIVIIKDFIKNRTILLSFTFSCLN